MIHTPNPTPQPYSRMVLGESVAGSVIEGFLRPGRGDQTVAVFGCFHGDEPKSVRLVHQLLSHLEANPSVATAVRWLIVPMVNPDGYARRRRRNARRVDLNRNFPTDNWERTSKRGRMYGGEAPASEPESRAVIDAIRRYEPTRIVTVHSISGNRQCNNYDGPAKAIAEAMASCNGYPVTASIGYPTPGSFGAWAGVEQGIATITLELPSHHSPKRCWEENCEALRQFAMTPVEPPGRG